MPEFIASGYSLPEAYYCALIHLVCDSDIVPCPAWDTRCKEVALTMVVEKPLAEPRISLCAPCGPRELEQYRLEMLDGILDWAVLTGKEPYTYHYRMGNQLEYVVAELKRDPWSRRAVVQIGTKNDKRRADPPCLQHMQFMIRDGKLNMEVLFRSNDAVKATFMNAFALICLQERIAGELGVEAGTYIHRVNSFHAYERDWALLEAYVRAPRSADYAGDWEEMMAEERPGILREMEMLKSLN